MKKSSVVAVIFLLFAGAYFFFFNPKKPAQTISPPGKTAGENSAVSDALANAGTNVIAIIESNFVRVQAAQQKQNSASAPSGEPSPLQITNFSPAIVLENMSRAVRQYGRMFGGNPVGTNPEITRQLAGSNPKHINFLNAEAGMRVNENGELVDPWDTPYFFHQISGTDMEIHSAGPDKIMWTSDDLVSK
jgi:hypothetical protein